MLSGKRLSQILKIGGFPGTHGTYANSYPLLVQSSCMLRKSVQFVTKFSEFQILEEEEFDIIGLLVDL